MVDQSRPLSSGWSPRSPGASTASSSRSPASRDRDAGPSTIDALGPKRPASSAPPRRLRGRAQPDQPRGALARRRPRLRRRRGPELRGSGTEPRHRLPSSAPGGPRHGSAAGGSRSRRRHGPSRPQPRSSAMSAFTGESRRRRPPGPSGTSQRRCPPLGTRRAFEQAEKLRLLDRERLAALREAAPSRKGAGVIGELLADVPLPLEETRSAARGDHPRDVPGSRLCRCRR